MHLERIAAVIRPRSPWEAVDLGFRMARTWWKPVWGSWLLAVGPLWLLALLFFPGPWTLLFLWWLRPLFDRVPLHVLGRKLFGGRVTPRSTWKGLPRLWSRQLVSALVFSRIDLGRSLTLAVGQLEGLGGAARRERVRVLRQGVQNTSHWLTAAALGMELCLFLSLYGLLELFTPEARSSNAWDALFGLVGPTDWQLLLAFAFVAHTLVEPFYVAGGFGLYLDRRTRLEGWDVELGFRRLAARLARRGAAGSGLRGAALLPLALASGWLALAPPLTAETADGVALDPPEAEAEAVPAAADDPQEIIRRILAQEDFRAERTAHAWRLRWRPSGGGGGGREVWLAELVGALAAVFEVLLWVLAAGGLVYLLFRHVPRASGSEAPERDPAGRADEAPAVLGPEGSELPADPPAAALALWQEGRHAEALAILYRGAMEWVSRGPHLTIHESWTEADCLRYLRPRLAPPAADYFAGLTAAWQSAAFAHRPPEDGEMRRLCAAWRETMLSLGTAGGAGGPPR